MPEEINQEIPNYKEIDDHKEAKATMKTFLEDTITKVEEETIDMKTKPQTKAILAMQKKL